MRLVLMIVVSLLIVACGDFADPETKGAKQTAAAVEKLAGTSTAGLIGPHGGFIELPGLASLEFPAGGLDRDQEVLLGIIEQPADFALLLESAALYGVTDGLSYQIRINTGNQQPLKPVVVRITMPEDFSNRQPRDSWVRLFGYSLLKEDGIQMELFEHCGGRFRPVDAIVEVPLVPGFFSTVRTSDNTYEAVVTLGVSPP